MEMSKKFGMFLLIFVMFVLGANDVRAELTLAEYLNQVESGNDIYKSSQSREKGFELRMNEWKLQTRPNLFGTIESTKDLRLTGAPAFQGTETQIKTYSLGVQQSTTFGLDAKFYYRYVDTNIIGVNPTLFPVPQFVVSSPVLELNQSLWRNFLGSEVAARQEISAAQVQAQKLTESFNLINLKANAETAFWRLVVARKMVASSQESLERAEKLQAWSTKRSRMSLTDKSDMFQAKATVLARKIDLQTAKDEEKSAALDFNKMRGIEDTVVNEKLDVITAERVAVLAIPEREGVRLDVKAAAENARAEKASAKLSAEATKPDIQVYAMLSLNGRDARANTSIDQSWSSQYPMTSVGVKFNMPLSFKLTSKVREGYFLQSKSADLYYQRKSFESEKDWENLVLQFEDSKKRLSLAREMEEAQKQKMEYERVRQSRGRTTTYQVIMFEQDFASAQVARINLEAKILNLYALLKTFGGSK
jgi:outer membrane protein TolC